MHSNSRWLGWVEEIRRDCFLNIVAEFFPSIIKLLTSRIRQP